MRPVPAVGPLRVVGAHALLASALVAVWPQHAASLVRLGVASTAISLLLVAVHALGPLLSASADRSSALDRLPPAPVPPLAPSGLRSAVTDLTTGHMSAGDRPLTEAAWRRLVVAASISFQQRGVDIDNPATRATAQRVLPSATWQRLVRPPVMAGRADGPAVAATVESVLDDLEAVR